MKEIKIVKFVSREDAGKFIEEVDKSFRGARRAWSSEVDVRLIVETEDRKLLYDAILKKHPHVVVKEWYDSGA